MSRVMMIVFISVLALATVAWLATTALTLSLHESDQAGNGLSYSFAIIGVVVTWLLVAVVLALAFRRVSAPYWTPYVAIAAFALSAVAAATVVNLLKDEATYRLQWPIITIIVAPLLMLTFSAWAAFPSVQRMLEAGTMFGGLWVTVIAVSVLPFPLRATQTKRLTAAREAYAKSVVDADSLGRANQFAALEALSDTTPLSEYLALVTESTELRLAVLERAKVLPRRQSDAIAMLRNNDGIVMGELRNLNLDATPDLCSSSQAFLLKHATDTRARREGTNNRFAVIESELDRYFLGAQWLLLHKCNLNSVVDAYKETALAFPESPERAQFLKKLETLRASE